MRLSPTPKTYYVHPAYHAPSAVYAARDEVGGEEDERAYDLDIIRHTL